MRRSTRHALVLAVLVGAAAAAYARKQIGEAGITVASFATDSPSRIPMFAVTGKPRSPDAPLAFLVHGYQCNKSMMLQLGRYLALNGVDSYAIDLPGHGASPEPHVDARTAPVAAEALEYLVRTQGLRKDRVVLVGHSYGATVLGRVLVTDDAYETAVLLGPGATPGFSATTPRNLLVVTGADDYDFVVQNARDVMKDALASPSDAASSGSEHPARPESRLWRVVPEVGHVGLLFSATTHRDVLRWIASATRHPAVAPERLPATAESVALALLVPGIFMLLAVLVTDSRSGGTAWPSARALLVLACAWAVALVALRYLAPLQLLRLREGELLASLILMAGLIATVLDIACCRGAHLPPLREAVTGFPAALAAAAGLYLCAALFLEPEWYHLALSPGRAGAALVLALTLFPFFAFCEGVLPARGAARVGVASLIYALAALSLSTLPLRLERFGPAIFALGVATAGVGYVVRRVGRAGGAAAFSALTTGWILAAGFIRY